MSYYRWPLNSNISLFLQLIDSNGAGVTGSDPHVAIRRYQTYYGTSLDNYYWNGSGSFSATAMSHSMTEVDPVNEPGVYSYYFSQSMIQQEVVYSAYFKNNRTPFGFASERHLFVASGSTGDVSVTVYESEID